MVDELAQIGGRRAFKEAVTLLRGYGLRCCLFLQSHAQLKSLWTRRVEEFDPTTKRVPSREWLEFGWRSLRGVEPR
jgi:hypothetical protein